MPSGGAAHRGSTPKEKHKRAVRVAPVREFNIPEVLELRYLHIQMDAIIALVIKDNVRMSLAKAVA
jgi:sRNA-binding protein